MGDAKKAKKLSGEMTHLRGRVFGVPHVITREKLDVIVSCVVGPKLGLDLPKPDAASIDVEAKDRRPYEVTQKGVAVISVLGTLVSRAGAMDALSGVTSYEQIATELATALADPEVKGIVLDIDSPGGEQAGCFDLVDKLHAARSLKPIYAAAHHMACSGGYAIASAADKLFVSQTGYVGSVGVITVHLDQTEADKQAGLKYTTCAIGARKTDFDDHTALSDEAKAAHMDRIQAVYDVFVAKVARGRGLKEADVRATEAAVYVGAQALESKLADAVGGREEAIAALTAQIEEKAMLKDLQARLDATLAENVSLKGRIDTIEKKADAEYVESLKQATAELQVPTSFARSLATVEARLAKGDREGARVLGDEVLALAKSMGQQKTNGGSTTQTLTPPAKDDSVAAGVISGLRKDGASEDEIASALTSLRYKPERDQTGRVTGARKE